jgi:hypothetical protein
MWMSFFIMSTFNWLFGQVYLQPRTPLCLSGAISDQHWRFRL